jgi:hypothetical protein
MLGGGGGGRVVSNSYVDMYDIDHNFEVVDSIKSLFVKRQDVFSVDSWKCD